METLNKSPRTSWREIQRHSALQKLEIHKGFLRFCALNFRADPHTLIYSAFP